MAATQAQEVVDRYFAAWTGKDFAAARRLLRDDLSFQGPLDRFDNADDYIAAISRLATMVTGVERRKVFADGQEVCEIYDLLLPAPIGRSPVAEWHTVDGEQIAAIRVFFDARPFAPPASP
jgi:SnoaL-like domain